MKPRCGSRGFTLMEALVIVAIIGLLVSIAIPMYRHALEKAYAKACLAERETANRMVLLYASENPNTSLTNLAQLVGAGTIKVLPQCPQGGVYVLIPGDGNSGYPAVGCSLHYWPAADTPTPPPPPPPPPPPSPIPGQVADWNMDEGQGNTVGSGETSGAISGARWVDDSEQGTALSFDGKNDYVAIAGDGTLKMPYEQMAYSAWFKSGEDFNDGKNPPGQKLISKNSNFHLSLGPSGDGLLPGVDMYLDGKYVSTGGAYAPGKGYVDLVIRDNEWHNLAATYDGSSMKLYKDGVLILMKAGLSGTVGSAGTSNSKLPVYLGAESERSSFFNGSLDAVVVFNRALTEMEIGSLAARK